MKCNPSPLPGVSLEYASIVISYNTIFVWLNYILQHEGMTNVKSQLEQLIHPKYVFIHSFAFHYVFFVFYYFIQLFAQDLVILVVLCT